MYVEVSGNGADEIKKALAFFKSHRVLVGIPQEKTSRGDKLNNAELAYIHSKGSPKHHIPARPFIEPGIEEAKDKIAGRMKASAIAALKGDTGTAISELHKAGQYGETSVRDYLKGGHLAPNAEITKHGGWMKNKVSGKTFYVKGKGEEPPLIDTGDLRKSISHIVEGE